MRLILLIELSFFIIGVIVLIVHTYTDVKSMELDDRRNYYMFGFSVAMLFYFPHSSLFVLGIAFGSPLLAKLVSKVLVLASGDVSVLSWVFFGLSIISLYLVVCFLWYLLIYSLVQRVTKWLLDFSGNAPFLPVILVSFVMTAISYF